MSLPKDVSTLQAQMANLLAALGEDDDLANQALYGSFAVGGPPASVKNVSKALVQPGGTMVRFTDGAGKEWTVQPGQTVQALGASDGMRRLEERGYIAITY